MPGPSRAADGATRRRPRDLAVLVGGVVLCLIATFSALGLGYFNFRFGQISTIEVPLAIAPPPGEPRNYLLIGTDSRAGLDPDDPANAVFFDDEGTITTESGKRTDTIMLLRVDPTAGTAQLLSFPRDLYVPIADTGRRDRINAAFIRGEDVLIETIKENFGIPIHHYVEIDFVGFLDLVDAVGGVPFYFPEPVRDTNSGLIVPEAGCITLNSRQSLSFVRSRFLERQNSNGNWVTADQSGDFGRISRQQDFIKRAISKAVSSGLSNPARLNGLVSVVVDSVTIDKTLDASDILSLANRFRSFDPNSLQTYSLPAVPFRAPSGASVLDLDDRQAEPIFNLFRGLDPDEVSPNVVGVTVFNGTGAQGLAADVTAALDLVGFDVHEPADTVDPFPTSTVFYATGSENAAIRLARHLTSSVEFGIDDDLDEGEVVLVVGDDFTTVHDQPSPTMPELPTTTTTTAPPDDAASTTTTPPATTSTTAPIGYLPGDAPDGVACT